MGTLATVVSSHRGLVLNLLNPMAQQPNRSLTTRVKPRRLRLLRHT